MTKARLYINAEREAYSPEDVRKTLTVGELIRILDFYDEDAEIILSFDNGYTYGGITEQKFDDEYEEE